MPASGMARDTRLHVVFWRWYSAHASWGGGEARLLAYLRHLDPARAHATVLTNTDLLTPHLHELRLPARVQQYASYHDEPRWKQYAAIVHLFRQLRPDRLVIMQGGFGDFMLTDIALATVAQFPRICRPTEFHLSAPLVADPSAAETDTIRSGSARAARRIGWRGRIAAQVIAVSEGARARMVDTYGYPPSRTRVIHHGIDPQRFALTAEDRTARRLNLRARLGIPAHAVTVVSTARFSPEKHVDWIADAAVSLSTDRPDVHWLFVGDGPLRPAVEDALRAHPQCRNRVHFTGFVPDVGDYLLASDVFVLASEIEGLSNAMLEAMAAGLVAVCTRAPGADDAITHGVSGLLSGVSAGELRAQLETALDMGADARTAMQAAAQATVRERFDVRHGIQRAMLALGLPMRNDPVPLR